ncbi:hypothetical protein CYMTET_48544 [Cymbomonas tetramitiformis]|uniref:N-acetyltransferase domain-containing protein n=1 Tax=Cymbomonas tetramitiformis TaxID=36881 RepID=A0AAE0EV20_9CHLO|nr:hypothetical protein CYMTET_48544 [Cymbomonas tetramitiformis]
MNACCILESSNALQQLQLRSTSNNIYFIEKGPARFDKKVEEDRPLLSCRSLRVEPVRPLNEGRVPSALKRFLPEVIYYYNDPSFADPEQVAQLWDSVGLRSNSAEYDFDRVSVAINKSFSVALAVVYDTTPPAVGSPLSDHLACGMRLVGFIRAISDGAFVASICDITVDQQYQGRGIGRKLVRRLVNDMRDIGPSSFAVFPAPAQRSFFFKCGFRLSHRYVMMRHTSQQIVKETVYEEEETSAQQTHIRIERHQLDLDPRRHIKDSMSDYLEDVTVEARPPESDGFKPLSPGDDPFA